MSQRQQLERIMEIDRSIRAGEYPNADRMAEQLEVSRRVIFNDREFMIHRLGAPIEYDRTRGGWYYTNKTWVLPGMIVTEGELMAFFLSVEISKRFLGTNLESSLRAAVEKISKGVTGPVSVDMDTLRSYYTFSGPSLSGIEEETLIDLHHAITNQQCVWIRYYAATNREFTERTVHPYQLHSVRGDWYLIAYDLLRNDLRNFRVSRIEKWKVLNQKFIRDKEHEANDRMKNSFLADRDGEVQNVSIWFSSEQAYYIRERKWHPSQKIQEFEDGSIILHLQSAGLTALKRWILQYGSHAQVLEPQTLRDDCIQEIKKMDQRYKI
jgi:predicted DNA-binding transcriptional regulator YafY